MNYINDNCIYRVGPTDTKLPGHTPDRNYMWQFYLRRGLFNPQFAQAIGDIFWYTWGQVHTQKPFQISGLETAATPLVSALVMSAPGNGIENLNAFITRADRKPYGLCNRFEGIIDYSLPVMIVDDLSNSGKSMATCANYLKEEGLEIFKYGFSIVNVEKPGFMYKDENAGDIFTLYPLFQHVVFPLMHGDYEAYVQENNITKKTWIREKSND